MQGDILKDQLFGESESPYDEGIYAPIGGTGTNTALRYLPGAESGTHTLDLWPYVIFGSEPGRGAAGA